MSRPGEAPFVYRRRPRWQEVDAARIVYTMRLPDYGMEAIEAWLEDRTGKNWYTLNLDWNLGTPFVHVSADLLAPATPRDELVIGVWPRRLGRSSLTFEVAGVRAGDGTPVFRGRYVCVCVVSDTMEPVPVDPRIAEPFRRDMARATSAGG